MLVGLAGVEVESLIAGAAEVSRKSAVGLGLH
jgi:hypothetical protein